MNTHIDCLNNSKCSVRYIFKATKQGALKVTLHHFLLPNMKHDSSYTVYINVQEIIFDNCPKHLGKSVTTTTTLDANLLHCHATGASLTACLHFCNQTPSDWYCKKQATVETATYGSECVATKTATGQIMDMRYTLRYLRSPHHIKIIYVW